MFEIEASPSKRFFVNMLTRDISLKDAILDLLDNCVDGIQREIKGTNKGDKPYAGFFAKLRLSPNEFIIEDNCGGISEEIAKKSAFRLGRIDTTLDDDIPTVGMYGIGMKRAIFKMGEACDVVSRHKEEAYKVSITPEWLKDETSNDCWRLNIEGVDKSTLPYNGTRIQVSKLYEGIAFYFNESRSDFVKELRSEISEFFALTLKLGFDVYVNDQKIKPVEMKLLSSKDDNLQNEKIEPYRFKGKFGDVGVELAVGFYRAPLSESELEAEEESPHSKENAGWTVICNDRVVLYADQSMITGWGRGAVPRFHNQFIGISGIVVFKTDKSMQLPVTTTKRGLDTSSEVYLSTLEYMMEGMKLFTNFTNKWKGRSKEVKQQLSALESTSFNELVARSDEEQWTKVRKPKGNAQDAQKLMPKLPFPKGQVEERVIQYKKPVDEIAALADYFYEGLDQSEIRPSEIGEKCFDEFLKKVR